MSQYDVPGLYQFLLHTPEQGLRKMLVDNKPMSEAHFNLLMKVVKTCDEAAFCQHFEKTDFPKVKMGPAETKLKEKFWADCVNCFNSRGLLGPAIQKPAA
ncbi:MAG: hypothetical protein KF802_12220 [Bdellovibrionaceae bacterium]|nr:hypothetical protein [Pseudobdellovibrionaceae bacterium]MBX3032883.1 hypothetical protein [Pseudobdellovibrionaceae bacterium]